MKYEIPDHVVKNILAIVNDANIKGSHAEAIIEIKNCFSMPVDKPADEQPK